MIRIANHQIIFNGIFDFRLKEYSHKYIENKFLNILGGQAGQGKNAFSTFRNISSRPLISGNARISTLLIFAF